LFSRAAFNAVRPGETDGAARQDLDVDVVGHRDLAGVNGEDAFAPAHVGTVHDDAAIETARAQQRRIEHVRAVRGRHQDDAFVRFEAVHLDQQLVQGLFALVVTAAEAGAAMAADRVDLVDEDDARRVLLALLEQVAHARRADADEHLDEVGAADREERHVRFTRDRAREQGLAGSRRAHQQHALRNTAAELLELLRLFQELDDFLQLALRFFRARDVAERHLLLRRRRQLRLALAERQRLVAAALHLAHEEDPETNQEQDRRPREQQRGPRRGGRFFRLDDDLLVEQAVDETFVLRRQCRPEFLLGQHLAGQLIAGDRDRRDLTRVHPVDELGEADIGFVALKARREVPNQADQNEHGHPENDALYCRVQHFLQALKRGALAPQGQDYHALRERGHPKRVR